MSDAGASLEPVRRETATSSSAQAMPETLGVREPVTLASTDTTWPSEFDVVIRGRVVDGRGAPLGGIDLRVTSRGAWSDEHAGDTFPALPYQVENPHGWSTTSGMAGDFEIRCPVPDHPLTTLTVDGSRVHETLRRYFAADLGSQGLGQLRPGINDVGSLRLHEAGVVRARLLDDSGRILSQCRLTSRPASRGPFTQNVTDSSGHFEIPHIPVGPLKHRISVDGFRSFELSGPVIEGGRTLELGDLTLVAAPPIQGQVLDEQGKPVEGAHVRGSPSSHAPETLTITDDRGRFTLQCPDGEAYVVRAEALGFLHLPQDSGARWTNAGTRDLKIRLVRSSVHSIRVVDAETRRPISTYRASILLNGGEQGDPNARSLMRGNSSGLHRDGRSEVTARAGIDRLTIRARNGTPQRFDVVPHEPSEYQTIAYRSPYQQEVVVLRDGNPVEGAWVVRATEYLETEDVQETVDSVLGGAITFKARTDHEGRVRIPEAEPYLHTQVMAWTRAGEVALDGMCRPQYGSDHIELNLSPGSTLRGRVLLDAPMVASDITVHLDELPMDLGSPLTPDGEFWLTSIPRGSFTLTATDRLGRIAGKPSQEVNVRRNDLEGLVLDLRAHATVLVQLELDLGQESTEDTQVLLVPTEVGAAAFEFPERLSTNGLACAHAPLLGECRVEVRPNQGLAFEHPSARILLVAGEPRLGSVRFDLRRPTLDWPEPWDFDASGTLSVRTLAKPDHYASTWIVDGRATNPVTRRESPFNFDRETRSIKLPCLPLGSHELELVWRPTVSYDTADRRRVLVEISPQATRVTYR